MQTGLQQFASEDLANMLLMFNAHSLLLDVINRGDPDHQEVGASVQAVMEQLNFSHEYLLCYQPWVRTVQWLGPAPNR